MASYKGVTIKPGSDADVAAQVAAIDAGGSAAPTTPTPTTPSTGGAATPATAYKGLNIGAYDGGDADAVLASGLSRAAKDASSKLPTEQQIYRDKLKLYQKEIDATNQIYTQKLAEARQQGLSNLGSGRAIQARSGTLGSDFAVSQNADITAQNTGVYNTILAEQNAKINSLLGLAKKDASEELAAKRLAQQKGLQDTITYLAGQSERAAAKAKKVAAYLLDQGIEYDQADPTQLAAIAKQYKVSVDDIKSSYLSEKKTRADNAAKAALEGQFSLSPEEMRFDASGKLLAQGGPKTYAPQDSLGKIVKIGGVDYIQNSDGTFSLPSVPGGDTSGVATSQLTTARNAIIEAKKLAQASGRGRSWIEGVNQGINGATDYTNLEAYANTLRTSILTLATDPQIKKFFGPQMSNADVQLMTSAGTALNPELMSPEQFNAELLQLETLLNKLEGAAQQPGGAGGMTPEERQQLINEGFDPDDGSVSFNQVGNTTASAGNVPQRNNNPGNVKVGGIGDRFAARDALGRPLKDAQGHLIFPNPQAGLMALEADINAKISGNSQAAQNKLGKQIGNLAELNTVYAEDPNWKNNVIAYLGKQGVRVNASTPVSSIPKQQLIQAIMMSEGYYA